MLQLTFNHGLTLTGFRTTQPWRADSNISCFAAELIRRMRVEGSRIQKEEVADSRIFVCVAEWPARRTSQSRGPGFEFCSDHYLDLFDDSHEFKSGGQASK